VERLESQGQKFVNSIPGETSQIPKDERLSLLNVLFTCRIMARFILHFAVEFLPYNIEDTSADI
jgi:hypothetical protein